MLAQFWHMAKVSGVSSDTSVSVNTWLTVSKSLTGSDTVFDGTIPWTSLSTLEIISDQGPQTNYVIGLQNQGRENLLFFKGIYII